MAVGQAEKFAAVAAKTSWHAASFSSPCPY